ncbi:nuclear transport factor 2 family protein [Pseudonocardia nematodicida]|uniref:Nuclear transport factor 2 family protein n=1 Tax=Pseudonocardia nematodicida TaxID=1206997 RepID=A0ABV1KDU0_9PSEU
MSVHGHDDVSRRATVERLECVRFDAVVDGDWDRFEELCHPDLVYVHNTGVVDTRATYLAKLRSGHYDYEVIEHPVTTIVLTADAALVWGRMRAELRAGTVHKSIDNLTLSVWVHDHDRGWLLIAQQPTPGTGPL